MRDIIKIIFIFFFRIVLCALINVDGDVTSKETESESTPSSCTLARLIRSFCTQASKMKTAAVLLAEGAEEMETVISVDVLRRGGV